MHNFRFPRLTALLALAATLAFGACDKDANVAPGDDALAFILTADDDATVDALVFGDESERDEVAAAAAVSGEAGHTFAGDCFQLIYPVGIVFPDQTTVTVDSAADIRAAVRAWIAANPDRPRPRVRPRLAFPLDVQLADGTIETLDGPLELRALLRTCRPEAERCFTLVYPVSYSIGDTVRTFNTAAELRMALQRIRRANADRPGRPIRAEMVYPITVETADGNLLTIDGPQGFRRLRASCGVDRPHANRNCYTYVFPISGTNRAGTTVTVNNERELRRMLSHANGRGRFQIVYPINVTLANGTVVELASGDAFRQLRRRCG